MKTPPPSLLLDFFLSCLSCCLFFFFFFFFFSWSKPMSNEQHNHATQACAAHHQLPEASFYTSTSIRRGNALTTEMEVSKIRSQRNLACAWSQNSTVALTHYCPLAVMVQPGSLFFGEDKKHQELFAQMVLNQYQDLLCKRCGFPSCKCTACGQLGRGSARMKHQCWLESVAIPSRKV